MPDAIDVLVTDHRTVDRLFEQVEDGGEQPDQDVVHQLVRELAVHDAIERAHLYPRLRHEIEGGGHLADRSEYEHTGVANELLAVDRAHPGSAEQRRHLVALMELVRAHILEEETEIFPALRREVDSGERAKLGDMLEVAKRTAPSRPHPGAPAEGMGTKLAGVFTAPFDRARDAAEGR